MGFTVTPPTDLPVAGDTSQDQLRWGETGPAPTVPANIGAGHTGGSTLTANSVDYNAQQAGRHSRATVDRSVHSDEGLFSSCVVKQGTFNVAGGTLNITLTPSRFVIDADDDGGVTLEAKIPAGSPETLTASKDTYVNFSEAGAFELQEVALAAPAPVPTAGFVAIWILTTDGTELTSFALADGIGSTPCLAAVGARVLVVEDLRAIVTSGAGPTDPFPLTNGATIASNEEVTGDATTKVTTGTAIALGQSEAGTGFTGIAGSVALLSQGAIISANKTLELGQDTPATIGEMARSNAGDQLYHNGDNLQAPGIAISQQQTANTGVAATITTLTTTTRQDAPVSLYVTVEIYISRAAAGSAILTIEEDNGVDGGGQVWSTLIGSFTTPNLSTAFGYQRFTRQRTSDSTSRLFRLVADGDGEDIDIKEALLTVYPVGG